MSKTSSEIIIDGIIEQIQSLKSPHPKSSEWSDDYHLALEAHDSYNQAIDDVIKLLKGDRT